MPLSSKQRRELKARAHHLKPVVRIGQQGLTRAVLMETGRSLEHHELIKVHIQANDRTVRKVMATLLCEQTSAELVGKIGNTFILYRKRQENP